MERNFSLLLFCILLNFILSAQGIRKDILKLEVRCFDSIYVYKKNSGSFKAKFILGIRNAGLNTVDLNEQIYFGHSGDDEHNDITFELLYLRDGDTVNVLKRVGFERTSRSYRTGKVAINPTASYIFEFEDLDAMYLKRTGLYMIRFTLLKKYHNETMTKNMSTDWVRFSVQIHD